MKNPTLILSSEDNRLYVFDMPEKPLKGDYWNAKDKEGEDALLLKYQESVKEAIANKVLVKDQLLAENELTYQHFKNKKVYILEDTPYPLSGYSVTLEDNYELPSTWNSDEKRGRFTQVAILTPVKYKSIAPFPDREDIFLPKTNNL